MVLNSFEVIYSLFFYFAIVFVEKLGYEKVYYIDALHVCILDLTYRVKQNVLRFGLQDDRQNAPKFKC